MTTPTADNDHTGREYVIPHATDDGQTLHRLPNVIAGSAEQAARRAAHNLNIGDDGVELIAVPARNWTVIKLHLKRTERLVTE